MCRWIAYLGEPMFLEEFVTAPRQSLVVQSRSSKEARSAVNGDGFGLGWYCSRDTPGLFRDVRPAWSDENLLSLAHQIKARLFFAHVRASTGTPTSRANCHPFAVGRWMFMHNGQIGGWDKVRRQVEQAIPDDLFQHRSGTTDSEALFLMMLGNGLAADPEGAARRTLGQIGVSSRGRSTQAAIQTVVRLSGTIGIALAVVLVGGEDVSQFKSEGDRYDVSVRLLEPHRSLEVADGGPPVLARRRQLSRQHLGGHGQDGVRRGARRVRIRRHSSICKIETARRKPGHDCGADPARDRRERRASCVRRADPADPGGHRPAHFRPL